MPYGSDRVGYGNCVPNEEEMKAHKIEMEKTERIISIKNKPSWHLTQEEKSLLAEYYGLK